MEISLHDGPERLSLADDDAQSYMDEDDVREVRLHHWLSETESARLMQESAHSRADSPVLGFDHFLTPSHDMDMSDKPLPELPTSIARLRSHSAASSTRHSAFVAAPAAPFQHRRSPSFSQNSTHSQSPVPSRRPSLARKPSLPLLAESAPFPPSPSVRDSVRKQSVSSTLSLCSNRNAVYIDSEQVSSRLDEWLNTENPEIERPDDEDLGGSEYYATSFQDLSASVSTPSCAQGPPPNTPMTAYYQTPHASSSQIYLGRGAVPDPQPGDEIQAQHETATAIAAEQEDVRATPVPHGKLVHPDLAISCSTPSSESSRGSLLFSAVTSSTLPTSAGLSSTSVAAVQSPPLPPKDLTSKPSLASLSRAVLSPKPSQSSIGLAYQTHTSSTNMLSPPPATASRWSLTSSIADDGEKDKKKEKGRTRKRLALFISKLAGNNANKEAKESFETLSPNMDEIYTRERSFSDASLRGTELLPPAKIKSRRKPPSLKLGSSSSQSVFNLRSPALASKVSLSSLSAPFSPTKSLMSASTLTPTLPASVVGSPVSASFAQNSPIRKGFTSTRLSVSTSMTTTSTNTASPLMPNTPILNDAPLASPVLKNAVSVPVLSPAWEGPGLIRRDNSYGMSMNSSYFGDSVPPSPIKSYGDEDNFEDDAEYYTREFSIDRQDTIEEERQARLSLITDMLDRDLNAAPQPDDETAPEPPRRDSLFYKPKGTVKIDVAEAPSPTHFRKSSSASRTSSSIQRRSVSGPHPISLTSTPPPLASKNGFRGFAARIGISNSVSTPHSPPSPETESKRKSLANLMSSGKRKASKRRLVISGVGDGQGEVDALKEWCSSLGEIRSMMKVKSVEGVVTEISHGERRGQNVWVVDFKKSSVTESVSRLQAKVEIKGAGSVRLSWESPKPKLSFNVGKMGWMP